MGGADDDVGNGRGNADLDTRVTLLSKLALEELVELGVEDTVCACVLVNVPIMCTSVRLCAYSEKEMEAVKESDRKRMIKSARV